MTATRSKKTVAKDVEPYIEIPVRTRPTKVAQHPPKTIPKKVKRKGATAAASTQSAPNTGAAAAAEKAKDAAGADGGDEDSDDDENSSAEVERMLTSPGKTQGDKGTVSEKATRRDTTAVPETENEGEGAVFPGPTRSQRAARSYGKKASTSKDKEKTHEPQVEEAGDEAEDEVDQLDSDDAAPPAAQKENVPPAAASSSKRPASASQGKKQRPPPKKRVVTRQTSQTPSSRPSPDQQAPFDGLANSMTKKAAKEVETGISHPPRIFQHRTPNGWRPDKIWVHDEWDEPGERGNVVKYIEDHGGKVKSQMQTAQVAILPSYAADRYAEIYADANASPAIPVTYLWLKDCSERSSRDKRPTRFDPMRYAASFPVMGNHRARWFNDDEKDTMVEFYASVLAGTMGRREMSEKLERIFYDKTGRTTSDYRDLLHQKEDEIKQILRERRRAAADGQLFNDDDADSSASLAHEQLHRKRHPRLTASTRRQRPRHDAEPSIDYTTELTRLSLAYKRPAPLVESISLSCSLFIPRTETVLAALKEWELATIGLPIDDAVAGEAAKQLLDEVGRFCWSPKADKEVVKGKRSLEDIAKKYGKSVAEVEDRRALLAGLGDNHRLGWYPDEGGLRRVLEERWEDDSEQDDGELARAGEDDEEELLHPLTVPLVTSA